MYYTRYNIELCCVSWTSSNIPISKSRSSPTHRLASCGFCEHKYTYFSGCPKTTQYLILALIMIYICPYTALGHILLGLHMIGKLKAMFQQCTGELVAKIS